MSRFKSEIKKLWPENPETPGPFPFDEEYPCKSPGKKKVSPPEYLFRCAGVALIISLTAVLGHIWGDARYTTVQQTFDIPQIQQIISGVLY